LFAEHFNRSGNNKWCQTTPLKCRFSDSLQFRVRFKCNWCKWHATIKALFVEHFNRSGNNKWCQSAPLKCDSSF
jgi:hypothetical protein